MALPAGLARSTVIRQRAKRANDHGSLVPDWSQPPDEIPIGGCSVQPATNAEDMSHRTASSAVLAVWMPPDADVTGDDHLLIDGFTRPFQIIGEPEFWRGIGFLEHAVVRLETWEG